MNKFLLGLVLGTLLGFAFAELIRNKTVDHTASPAARDIAAPANDAPANTPLPDDIAPDAPASSQPGVPPTVPRATQSASAPSTIEQGSASSTPARVSDATAAGAASTRIPIAVPDEIKPFLEKKDTHDGLTLGQTHTKLEDEAEDLAWSYQMEIYLQQSFARATKSGQPLDIRVIECRTTLCEIVGFSPLPNPTDDISAVVQYMSQQPWWDFDNFNTTAEGGDNGGKFLIFLRRKR